MATPTRAFSVSTDGATCLLQQRRPGRPHALLQRLSTHACVQDDRVVPAHSFKMAAALQTTAGASPFQRRPLLVRIESNAGHGAGKPTSKVLAELADTYSFLHTELAKSK